MGFFGNLFGSEDRRAARESQENAERAAGLAAKTAASGVALQKENIALQREGLVIAREGIAVAREETEFQRSQYNDWKDVYGDLQDNIGEYYKTLGPERIIAQGLQAEQQEYQKARTAITKSLAQRGISGSGVEGAALTTLEGQHYTNRASVRATAEQKVIDSKTGFLGIGLGQGAQLLGVLAQATGQTQNAYGNITQAYGGVTNAYNVASGAYGQQVGAYNQQSENQTNLSRSYLQSATARYSSTLEFASSLAGAATGFATGSP